jgi:hypothetical protein
MGWVWLGWPVLGDWRAVAVRWSRLGTIGSSSSFVQWTSFVQNRFGEDSLLERTDANELSHLPPPGTKLGEEPTIGTLGTEEDAMSGTDGTLRTGGGLSVGGGRQGWLAVV